jgi:RHS repeat-associated protein
VTFTLAGQPIAVKVEGDPTSTNNGIFYIHTDHLGSTAVLTKDSDGYVRTDSLVRYNPFGGYRGDLATQDLTDRGYTGHRENLDIGLIYMNARFYVSGIGRFASADTMVPDSNDPQSFNRYTYVRNSPLYYTDPSGHCFFTPIDALLCSLVGVALLVENHYNPVEPQNLESNPYDQPIEGPPNVIVANDKLIPNVTAGVGTGGEIEVNTYYHVGSDTFATVGCGCAGLTTPNLSASASVSAAWTEANNAAQVAEGFYQSVNVGVGPAGFGRWTGASPILSENNSDSWYSSKGSESFSSFMGLESSSSQVPGTTGYTVSFGAGIAPASLSAFTCQCSIINSGSFADVNVPWYIDLADLVYDNYDPQ